MRKLFIQFMPHRTGQACVDVVDSCKSGRKFPRIHEVSFLTGRQTRIEVS